MRRTALIQAVTILVAMLLATAGVPSALASHGGGHVPLSGSAWDHTQINVRVNIGQGVGPAVVDAVNDAIAAWNTAIDSLGGSGTVADFQLVPVTSGKATITIVLRKGGNPLDPTVGTAFTLVSGDGRFFKVKIQVIGQQLGIAATATLVFNIVLHELGHALGLGHYDGAVDLTIGDGFTGDLMQPTLPTDGDDVALSISLCDKTAFATAHAWYPASSPLGDPADFIAPTAGTLEDC